jgi:hypothetical protein
MNHMISTKASHKLNHTIALLKWTYGLTAIILGADKFFHFLTDWSKYLSPLVSEFLPSVQQGLYAIGILEIIVGVIILSHYTRIGAYLVALWFFIVVADLVSMHNFYDIALRDFVLGIGALTLGRLISLRKELSM